MGRKKKKNNRIRTTRMTRSVTRVTQLRYEKNKKRKKEKDKKEEKGDFDQLCSSVFFSPYASTKDLDEFQKCLKQFLELKKGEPVPADGKIQLPILIAKPGKPPLLVHYLDGFGTGFSCHFNVFEMENNKSYVFVEEFFPERKLKTIPCQTMFKVDGNSHNVWSQYQIVHTQTPFYQASQMNQGKGFLNPPLFDSNLRDLFALYSEKCPIKHFLHQEEYLLQIQQKNPYSHFLCFVYQQHPAFLQWYRAFLQLYKKVPMHNEHFLRRNSEAQIGAVKQSTDTSDNVQNEENYQSIDLTEEVTSSVGYAKNNLKKQKLKKSIKNPKQILLDPTCPETMVFHPLFQVAEQENQEEEENVDFEKSLVLFPSSEDFELEQMKWDFEFFDYLVQQIKKTSDSSESLLASPKIRSSLEKNEKELKLVDPPHPHQHPHQPKLIQSLLQTEADAHSETKGAELEKKWVLLNSKSKSKSMSMSMPITKKRMTKLKLNVKEKEKPELVEPKVQKPTSSLQKIKENPLPLKQEKGKGLALKKCPSFVKGKLKLKAEVHSQKHFYFDSLEKKIGKSVVQRFLPSSQAQIFRELEEEDLLT